MPVVILTGQGAAYLGELCQNFVHLQSGSERHVELIRDADHLTLDVDRAINVALIAGEAITNALKHAFPEGQRGTIQVGLHRLGEDVLLYIEDNGIGLSWQRRGLGRSGCG